jgi:hypothetical protein
MENQKTIIAATNLILAKQQEMHSWITTKVANRHEVSLSSAPTSIVHTITRQEWIRSRLSWLGVRQRRTTRYLSIPTSRQKSSGHTPNNIIEDRHDVILSWPFFAYGFHVDWQWSYGSILPSLRVYPIIKDFRPYEYMMQKSSIAEWQQMFETGALSPFVRTPYGSTLLHVSIVIHSTVCRKTDIFASKLSCFADQIFATCSFCMECDSSLTSMTNLLSMLFFTILPGNVLIGSADHQWTTSIPYEHFSSLIRSTNLVRPMKKVGMYPK